MRTSIPQVTLNLLLINVLMFIVSQVLLANGSGGFVGSLSAYYFNSVLFQPFQVVSHMFMHSMEDIMHIFMNMFLLVIFGSHLERLWGARRFFIFYIACGLGAYFLYSSIGVYEIMQLRDQISAAGIDSGYIDMAIEESGRGYFFDNEHLNNLIREGIQANMIPANTFSYAEIIERYRDLNINGMVGASGAIFGLLGAFVILFPNTDLYMYFIPIPIKAKYLIGGYIVFEVINSINTPADNIAHLAHVGGAAVGIAIVLIRRRMDRKSFW
jgi:membrane associated rhomboid family serine protease